jgi:hypothetical protein
MQGKRPRVERIFAGVVRGLQMSVVLPDVEPDLSPRSGRNGPNRIKVASPPVKRDDVRSGVHEGRGSKKSQSSTALSANERRAAGRQTRPVTAPCSQNNIPEASTSKRNRALLLLKHPLLRY